MTSPNFGYAICLNGFTIGGEAVLHHDLKSPFTLHYEDAAAVGAEDFALRDEGHYILYPK